MANRHKFQPISLLQYFISQPPVSITLPNITLSCGSPLVVWRKSLACVHGWCQLWSWSSSLQPLLSGCEQSTCRTGQTHCSITIICVLYLKWKQDIMLYCMLSMIQHGCVQPPKTYIHWLNATTNIYPVCLVFPTSWLSSYNYKEFCVAFHTVPSKAEHEKGNAKECGHSMPDQGIGMAGTEVETKPEGSS